MGEKPIDALIAELENGCGELYDGDEAIRILAKRVRNLSREDIEELKRAQQAIRSTHERLKVIRYLAGVIKKGPTA